MKYRIEIIEGMLTIMSQGNGHGRLAISSPEYEVSFYTIRFKMEYETSFQGMMDQ